MAATEMTVGRWLRVRLVPGLLLVAAGTVAAGLVRGLVLYVPGILGMATGGATGWLWGRLGRGDPEDAWSFGNRLWLAAGAAVLYAVGAAATVSVLRAGLMGAPLEWLVDVAQGLDGELFAGTSVNSLQSVSGVLRGAWWLVFGIVDALLFAFLFLVLTMVGAFPQRETEPDGAGIDDAGDAATSAPTPRDVGQTPGIDGPTTRDTRWRRVGRLGFAAFALAAIVILAGLHLGPAVALSAAGGPSTDDLLWRLEGEWRLDDSARFLGETPEERTFTLSRGLGEELAGMPDDPARFMLTVARRRDGVFEGRLYIRGADILPLRLRPSDDLDTLELVVDWWGVDGRRERRLTARRLSGGS